MIFLLNSIIGLMRNWWPRAIALSATIAALAISIPDAFAEPAEVLEKATFNIVAKGQKMYLVSENGRYVVSGDLYDNLNQQRVDNPFQFVQTKKTVNSDALANIVDTNGLTIGYGEKHLVIFADPNCRPCHTLIENATSLPADEYKTTIVVLPLLGESSARKAESIYCLDDPEKRIDALLGAHPFEDVPVCSSDSIQRATRAAAMVGVLAVPTLVTPSGSVTQGLPRNLLEKLENVR